MSDEPELSVSAEDADKWLYGPVPTPIRGIPDLARAFVTLSWSSPELHCASAPAGTAGSR